MNLKSIQNVVKTLISSTPFTPPPTSFQSPEKEAANQKAAAASSWLEQIRGRDAENGDSHKMALEMSSVGKLMALQSLQNSLQLISMGMATASNPLERLRHLQQHQQQQQQQLEAKDPPAPPQSPKEDLLAPPQDNSNYLMGLIRGHAAQAQQAPEYR